MKTREDKRRCVVVESQVTEASQDLEWVQLQSQVPEAAKKRAKNKNFIAKNKNFKGKKNTCQRHRRSQ